MADDLLTPEDLAYMRTTQDGARPTAATFRPKITTRSSTGGSEVTYAVGTAVTVRIDGSPDEVPAELAARFEGGTLVKITTDILTDVRDGDHLDVAASEAYEFVTDGDPDRWATAQVLWARRVSYPAR